MSFARSLYLVHFDNTNPLIGFILRYYISTGLSSSTDTQIKQILETVALALHEISIDDDSSGTKSPSPLQRLRRLVSGKRPNSKSDIIVPHSVEHSNEIPVIIIDGFLSREKGPHQQEMWENLAEWAALLIENRVAHVIFVTQHVGAVKVLGKCRLLCMCWYCWPSACKFYTMKKEENFTSNIDELNFVFIRSPHLFVLYILCSTS